MHAFAIILIVVSFLNSYAAAADDEEQELRRLLPYLDYREDVTDESGRLLNTRMEEVASSKDRWTGIAVAWDGRVFVCFPRWSDYIPMSVGVLDDMGNVIPYPNDIINYYDKTESNPAEIFVCVQALFADSYNNLWVLDAGNPKFEGVIKNAPKLVKINLRRNKVSQIYTFDEAVTPKECYLNDVRVEPAKGIAYITDSGVGALIVLNLNTGKAIRLLENHYSVKSEDIAVTINGEQWLRNGTKPRIHIDGIAVSPNGSELYYQALTGKTIYMLPTIMLKEEFIRPALLASEVKVFAETGPADGFVFDRKGYLYITSLEDNSIKRFTPAGELQIVFQDERICWPDSMSFGPLGNLYFTTSRINEGDKPKASFKVYKIIFE